MRTWATLLTKQLAGLLEVVNAPRAGMAVSKATCLYKKLYMVYSFLYTIIEGTSLNDASAAIPAVLAVASIAMAAVLAVVIENVIYKTEFRKT